VTASRAVCALLAVGVIAGCGGQGGEGLARDHGPAPRSGINERTGSYGGVRLGDTKASVSKKWGSGKAGGKVPQIDSVHAPTFLPGFSLSYRDAELTIVRGPTGNVGSISVVAHGARTLRGVRVGDRIGKVSKRYSGAVCFPERIIGGDYASSARCELKTAPGVYLYFGDDPIKLIVLSDKPFGDKAG
jgi:hypothetical protein